MEGFLTTPRSLPTETPLLASCSVVSYSHGDAPLLMSPCDRSGSGSWRTLTVSQLVGMYAFCFGYGLCITSYALITFPVESVKFFPERHDFGLALFMVLAGMAQLCGPAVGFFSDRSRHVMGKRRPFLMTSAYVLMPCLSVQWYASAMTPSTTAVLAYYTSSFIGMVCLCVMQTVVVGLTPDLVPKHQTGQANGVLVAMLGCGAASGFLLVIMFPHLNLYLVYTVVLVVTSRLSYVHGDADKPSNHNGGWTWEELMNCYFISPKLHAPYFWLFLSRACYYTGVSTQSFLQYYFRDWVLLSSGAHIGVEGAHRYTAAAAFFSQIGLALSAVPAGRLSDHIGREVVLHTAAVGIACCYLLNVFFRDVWAILLTAFVYGILNGASLSVSYALAVDTLPSRESGAQWLAIWDVAAFIGSTVGPVLYSPALYYMPPRVAHPEGYIANADGGYMLVMVMGSLFVLLGSVFLLKVSRSREELLNRRESLIRGL